MKGTVPARNEGRQVAGNVLAAYVRQTSARLYEHVWKGLLQSVRSNRVP
jgi:hypothetical protein